MLYELEVYSQIATRFILLDLKEFFCSHNTASIFIVLTIFKFPNFSGTLYDLEVLFSRRPFQVFLKVHP